jgi:hypothetical protein
MDGASNGAGEIRVPFGSGPTDTMPAEWAADLLKMWRTRDPAGFGAALAEVVTGTKPRPARTRAPQ